MILSFKDKTPNISEMAYIAESAKVIGNVTIGESIVLFNAVIRGDRGKISITQGSRIPERSVVLGVPGKVVRKVTDEELNMIKAGAEVYVELRKEYISRS